MLWEYGRETATRWCHRTEGLPGWHLEVSALDGKSGEWGRAGGRQKSVFRRGAGPGARASRPSEPV